MFTLVAVLTIGTVVWTTQSVQQGRRGNSVTFFAQVKQSGIVDLTMRIFSRKTGKDFYTDTVSADTNYIQGIILEENDTYDVTFTGNLPVDTKRRELTLKIIVDGHVDDKISLIARSGESKGAKCESIVIS